jgi:rhodanese-related sulfurtransferase
MSISNLGKFLAQRKYLIILGLVAATLTTSAGILSIIAFQHHMSLPVYIQSWNTPQISVAELTGINPKSVVLIDVRSPQEYEEDHIGNSALVPLANIEDSSGLQQIQAIAQRYEQKYQTKPTLILYCTSGMRSIKANKFLSDRGYQPLTLTGGITAWREKFKRSQDLNALKFE